jgi:hypothetical protein
MEALSTAFVGGVDPIPQGGRNLTAMSIEIPTQPIPDEIAEACAWLSAAERYTGGPLEVRLLERLDAGDALNILLDVLPPYPPIDTTRPPLPLAEAAPAVARALESVIEAGGPAEQTLRAARALRLVRRAVQ